MIILLLHHNTAVMINRICAARDGELSIPSRIIGQTRGRGSQILLKLQPPLYFFVLYYHLTLPPLAANITVVQ